MKKLFTILAICFVCVTISAQKPILSENARKQISEHFTEAEVKTNVLAPSDNVTLEPGGFTLPCGLIPDELKAYVDDKQQWVTGSNGYRDTKYGYVFNELGGLVVSVNAYLFNGYDEGDASDIYAELYEVGTDGLPTTLLGTSQPISTSDISTEAISEYSFIFDSPVEVPQNFVAVITVPDLGETTTEIVVATSPQYCLVAGTENNPVSYSYLSETTQGWITLTEAWGVTTGGMFDLAIFPVIGTDAGINNVQDRVEFSIYPNPAKENFNIAASVDIQQVEIYNQVGQVVYSAKVGANNFTINISNFATGMYLVKVVSNEGTSVKPLSIAK